MALNRKQQDAIFSALETHCEPTQIASGGHGQEMIEVADIDPAARRAGVPEALALAELHRAFVNEPLNDEYVGAVKRLHRLLRMEPVRPRACPAHPRAKR